MRLEQDIHIVNFHLAQYYKTVENLRQEITALKERWVLEDWRLNYDQSVWTLAKQMHFSFGYFSSDGAGARELGICHFFHLMPFAALPCKRRATTSDGM